MVGNRTDICAIVIDYFGLDDTVACVRSLVPQGISEVVVLDNSGRAQQERALREALQGTPRASVKASKCNLGFAGGMNFVLRKTLHRPFGAYLLLNNDTLAPRGLVERLAEGIHRSHLDIAAPQIYEYPMKHRLWSKGHYYNSITGLITRKPIPMMPRTQHYLTGCCLMVKHRVFEKMGLFDESFFMYGEDIEFCHRAEKNGFRIGVVKDAQIYHRANASSQNNSPFYEFNINRGHFILSERLSRSKAEYMGLLPLKFTMMGIRAMVRTMRYRNPNALRGYIRAAKATKLVPDRSMIDTEHRR